MRMPAGQAMVKVLESWGVRHIYGIPASSLNGLMAALNSEKDKIQFVQVRQEQAGAMAAAAHAKLTGSIGVCFGSGGPGGGNLINGIYDAKMDHTPMLALIGQVATSQMNTTDFQEMDEIPLYADGSVYNRTAMTAEQIPHVIEDAIRAAYEYQGVAVVILPNNLVEQAIDYMPRTEEKRPPQPKHYEIRPEDIDYVEQSILEADNPVLYVGLGLDGKQDLVAELSERYNMPVISSALAIGRAIEYNHPNFMGSFGRLGTKPAYEAINAADLIIFAGSNFPFARLWPKDVKIIQINHAIADIGRQVHVEKGIVADCADFFSSLLIKNSSKPMTKFLEALRIDKSNWDAWLVDRALDQDTLTPESVLESVRNHASKDTIFALDIGNNTMHSVRMLPLDKNRRHVMSGWFAPLGVGLPYAVSAKLTYPERQVWSISGEGGFPMNMQEIITQVHYKLPVINIILNDKSYGFIEHAQIAKDFDYGVKLPDTDWATTCSGMGAISYTIKTHAELREAFDTIDRLQANGNDLPIVLDVKLPYSDPIDTAVITLDPTQYSEEEVAHYQKTYHVYEQPSLSEILLSLD